LPLVQKDQDGLYIPGYRIAPNCGQDYSDLKVRSCPVASMNKMASVITAFNRHQSGLIRLTEVFKSPSCAILESFDILDHNTKEMQSRLHDQQIKDLNHGSNSRN